MVFLSDTVSYGKNVITRERHLSINYLYFPRPLLIYIFSLPLPSKIFKQMANHKATKKDARQAAKRRERNRYYGKTTRNAIRNIRAAEPAEASEQLSTVESQIDKLAKRGVIHRNKAANLKSKLAKKINADKAAAK